MAKEQTTLDAGLLRAFQAYEAQARIANTKIGCVLVIILMPAGVLLDRFVYPDYVAPFFKLRLACSFLAAIILGILQTEAGKRSNRLLGMIVPMLPVVFIAWMIAITEGFASPYYAGLNLVLLAVSAVLHWTFVESLIAVSLVLLIYIAAGFLHLSSPGQAAPNLGIVVNNFYFIALMDLIVVVGTYFQYRSRLREFALRHELDVSRRQLEEGNRKLVEMDRVKTRFFANMSHELRTPLTLLIAPLETLLHRRDRLSNFDVQQLLGTMHANGMRLLKLINDLLDLERLDSGKMEVKQEPLQVEKFLRGLVSSVQAVASDKGLKLETKVGPGVDVVLLDRDKIEKVLLNLLFNAIKFTAGGGMVSAKVEREGEKLVFRVSDTGMGIADNQLPFIFDRFWQADNSARRKHQGTGIGLALVKELVEAQGGKVSATSEVNKGTTMKVELPYVAGTITAAMPAGENASAGLAPEIAATSEKWLSELYRRAELHPGLTPLHETVRRDEIIQGKKPLALIADDEPDMLRFLRSELEQHFQVLEAVDGLQAVEKAFQFLPEIILLDMMMPEKDGLQVCRELRSRTSTKNIPVILLTARADEETKLNSLSAGANDFLSKPFSTTELHVRVKNLVEQYQLQRKLARQNQKLEATLEQLKEAQAQLVHAEKMAGLGRMSAGIIHEINNPLNYAKTGLFALRKKERFIPEEQREDFGEILRDIEEGVDRVKNIVSDLRTFTHPSGDGVDSVDLHEVVTSALRFVSDQLKGIRVVNNVPEAFIACGNATKLVQVAVNLLQNSVDALKKKPFSDGEATITIHAREAAGKRILEFRDNGMGISAENLDKVFDPFFTTKDVGEGMGLGLSISHRIVTEGGGRISVQSEPGKFTAFTLEFPEECNMMPANNLG